MHEFRPSLHNVNLNRISFLYGDRRMQRKRVAAVFAAAAAVGCVLAAAVGDYNTNIITITVITFAGGPVCAGVRSGHRGRRSSRRLQHLHDVERAARLELREYLGEVRGLGVDAQHLCRHGAHDAQAPVPERVPAVLHQERLQRVRYLVAHVRVGQVQAREHHGLQLRLRGHPLVDQLPHQHVHEHHVRRVYERHVLLNKQQNIIIVSSYHINFYILVSERREKYFIPIQVLVTKIIIFLKICFV